MAAISTRSLTAASLLALPVHVASHGALSLPESRLNHSVGAAEYNVDGQTQWFSHGCQIGCSKCTGGDCNRYDRCCEEVLAPTLPADLRTYQDVPEDMFKHNPWMAPGHAPVLNACGVAGGFFGPNGGGHNPPDYSYGFEGTALPELRKPRAQWISGSTAEVGWGVTANHGGGYSYRLCPASGNLTEECFQEGHLRFVGSTSWIQHGTDKRSRKAIKAVRVERGTKPLGSQWTRNPVPACSTEDGGSGNHGCEKPQFQPPLPELFGYGSSQCVFALPNAPPCNDKAIKEKFNFTIVDLVEVPEKLSPGHYLLSWRWDCEQTAQVWTNCADVEVLPRSGRRLSDVVLV